MQEQEIPAAIGPERACALCKFSKEVRISPTDIQHVRVCKKNPPTPIVAFGVGQQPTIMPSMYPMVRENDWCFEFSRAAENTPVSKIVS